MDGYRSNLTVVRPNSKHKTPLLVSCQVLWLEVGPMVCTCCAPTEACGCGGASKLLSKGMKKDPHVAPPEGRRSLNSYLPTHLLSIEF